MARPTFTSGVNAIWTGSMLDGMMGGFKAMSSEQMTAATMLFGAWDTVHRRRVGRARAGRQSERHFAQGLTGLRAFYTMDVGVRYAAAWSYGTSLT